VKLIMEESDIKICVSKTVHLRGKLLVICETVLEMSKKQTNQISEFKYLGNFINSDGDRVSENKRQIQKHVGHFAATVL
jgi:hypothetical protein